MTDDGARVEILASTTMKDECFVSGCGEPVTAVCAYHSRDHRDIVIVWLCERHGDAFIPPDATTAHKVQEVTRTCRWKASSASICGAYATHAIVLGARYSDDRPPAIRVLSSCERHAEPHLRETWIQEANA